MNEVSPRKPTGSMIRIGGGMAVPIEAGKSYQSTPTGRVDICFIFGTTGSMTNKIDGLVASTVDLVGDLVEMNLDWRVTTVPFGDLTVSGDRVVTSQPFTTTQETAERQLRTMPRFSGGGNLGESSLEATLAGIQRKYRSDAVKVLVLITDEPALETAALTAAQVGGQLREAEVIFFAATPNLAYFKQWARDCGGTWTLIGQTMDNDSLRQLLRALVKQVAKVTHDVYSLTGGSVSRFLALSARTDPPIKDSK